MPKGVVEKIAAASLLLMAAATTSITSGAVVPSPYLPTFQNTEIVPDVHQDSAQSRVLLTETIHSLPAPQMPISFGFSNLISAQNLNLISNEANKYIQEHFNKLKSSTPFQNSSLQAITPTKDAAVYPSKTTTTKINSQLDYGTASPTSINPTFVFRKSFGLLSDVSDNTDEIDDSVELQVDPPANVTLQPGEIIEGCRKPGLWALTFDDGPSDMTNTLLDALAARNVKATFFVVGDSLMGPGRVETLRRAYREGHQIALHSQTHAHLADLTRDQVYAEIKGNLDMVQGIIGVKPRYFRCPYGECGGFVLDVCRELGLIATLWNVDTKDFEAGHTGEDTLQVVHLALAVAAGTVNLETANEQLGIKGELGPGLENGAIQLQHDTVPESIRITNSVIDTITVAGVHPVTVAECVIDPNGAYTI